MCASSLRTTGPLLRVGRRVLASLCGLLFCLHPIQVLAQASTRATVTVDVSQPANRFVPAHALGAGIDGHDKGVIDLQLTQPNIQAMLAVGFKSLTYRLRSELAGDAWHWNPSGKWSDETKHQGYWMSDSETSAPISLSYGYSLPRRGNTIDQANDEGYSRIDDGDASTFWKSNPYLDYHFTGESNLLHPQWVVIEFDSAKPINAIRILWGEPFATNFRAQYGNFDDVSDIALNPAGTWIDFPQRKIRERRGEDITLELAPRPIKARWLRLLLTERSEGVGSGAGELRDHVGFSIRELYAGMIDAKGNFQDQIQHAADRHRQTIIHVSSTDSWHRESDLDTQVEQAGLDRVYQNGLTNNRPMLLPVGLVYETPENAANQIRYLRKRGYQFERVELGEEPDGQYVTPEDFGALYLQWAEAIHRVDPALKLGGPSFQEILPDDEERPYILGNSEWLRRFLTYLNRRGRTADYSFFSFEWYPFDDVCEPVAPQLARAPSMLESSLREMERRGLSTQIPWIISEYGYSAFATRAELTLEGAILNADVVGKFLTLGGDQAFLFGYTPGYVGRDFPCTAGNNMLFSMGPDGTARHRFATYFGARLLTQKWLASGDEFHEIYRASSNARNLRNEELVTAYAVQRPDGLWSILLLNKDPKRTFEVNVVFRKSPGRILSGFDEQVEVFQYSNRQYELGGPVDDPFPVRAEEPEHRTLSKPYMITLPAYSLTVVRGR